MTAARLVAVVAIFALFGCTKRPRKCEVAIGAYTGDKATWCDGRPVEYEVRNDRR